jgi:hypothetical protein
VTPAHDCPTSSMPLSGIAFFVVHGSAVLYAVGANEGVPVVGVAVVGTAVGETPPVNTSTAKRFVLPLVYGAETANGEFGP